MGRPRRGPRVVGVYETARGRWQLRYIDGEGAKGFETYASEAEARHAAERISESYRELRSGLTVEDALNRYAQAKQRKWKPRTIAVAESAIRHLIGDCTRDLADVTPRWLSDRIEARLSEPVINSEGEDIRSRSGSTVATELRQLKMLLRWAAKCGLYRLAPALDAVRVDAPRPVGKEQLSADEARRYLREAVRRARGGADEAIAALCPLLLGVRAREVLDRRVRDLDEGGDVLWIRRGKTKRSSRRVRLPEPLRSLLLDQADDQAGPDAYLFGEPNGEGPPRSTSWLEEEVRSICLTIGADPVCPHGLRGTHATLAEAAGVSSMVVAASLGHTSPEVTGRHYTEPDARQGAAQERALRVLRGGKK